MNLVQERARIRECLFPAGCAICGEMLLDPEEALNGICEKCGGLFRISEEGRCEKCGKPLISEHTCCMQCRQPDAATHYFERIISIYPYRGVFHTMLHAYKFDHVAALGNFLIKQLDRAKGFFPDSAMENAVWVPVPPRPGKIKKAGWDQIEYLAQLLEKKHRHALTLPVHRCLGRLSAQSQKELGMLGRKTNLAGRIKCIKKVPRTALLFDDVFTTGSTMAACAQALQTHGTEKVYGICLFYA
ncbi:amidophosphoribosyltransferase [Spirochaetia bacterium]|nr:amidophosphoribosyltransferase [Spirochaetia bacterium]